MPAGHPVDMETYCIFLRDLSLEDSWNFGLKGLLRLAVIKVGFKLVEAKHWQVESG